MAKKLQRKVGAQQPKAQKQAAQGGAPKQKSERAPLIGGRSVSKKALAEFTSQLAVLLDAGLPVTRCLRILEGQMSPGLLKKTLAEIVDDVESGTSLSEAMAKHPKVYDELYASMIRAGEASGAQEEILNRLAGFMEKAEEVKARVKGALAYPVAVMVVAALVLSLVFIFVVPSFRDIFVQQFGTIDAMPPSTRLIINAGEHLKVYWWLYLGAILGLIILHRVLNERVFGYRRFCDGVVLKLPIFGKLIHKSLVARFSRTFGTLVQSGVPHLAALDIIGTSISNVRMSEAVDRIHSSIREGAGIAAPMAESEMFDDLVVNMVEVGEQTGELDRMLHKVSDRYEVEVDRRIDITIQSIEIVLIVVLAVVVGFIVFALLAPLLTLMDRLS
ncbi:MAG: type II secretion system F family protein [Planctomycetota bacterium]